jgi:hypothetical protein
MGAVNEAVGGTLCGGVALGHKANKNRHHNIKEDRLLELCNLGHHGGG